LFVVGEGGLGKTSVLGAAQREAEAAGMGVSFARGELIESGLAFGVARAALGELAGFDREPVADSSAPYYRALQGLQERSGGPLLVAVDDLHWADPDSLPSRTPSRRRGSHTGVFGAAALIGTPQELLLNESIQKRPGFRAIQPSRGSDVGIGDRPGAGEREYDLVAVFGAQAQAAR
jgi:hypothetical protein